MLSLIIFTQALCAFENDIYTVVHKRWQWQPATYAMKGVSFTANPGATIAVPAWCFLHDEREVAVHDLLGCIGSWVTVAPLKYMVNRKRPEGIYERWNASFPSGHTAIAFSHAYVVSYHYPKARIPLFLFATTVGFSRVYLGKHYPTDVIAGAVIGLIAGYLTTKLVSRTDS